MNSLLRLEMSSSFGLEMCSLYFVPTSEAWMSYFSRLVSVSESSYSWSEPRYESVSWSASWSASCSWSVGFCWSGSRSFSWFSGK